MKQTRYWLRGGILAMLLVVVVALLLFTLHSFSLQYLLLPIFPGIWFVLSVTRASVLGDWSYLIPGAAVLSLALYFIVGSIIGWIYGKIKIGKFRPL